MSAAWFAVETRPSAESQAARHLRRQPNVCSDIWNPTVWTTRRCLGQVVPVVAPVFAGYVFVETDLDNDRWRSINGTRGVKRMLQFGGTRPTAMPLRQFLRLRERIGDEPIQESDLFQHLIEELAPGDSIEVVDGPFQSLLGTVLETGAGRARVVLAFFGRQTETDIEIARLRRIEA